MRFCEEILGSGKRFADGEKVKVYLCASVSSDLKALYKSVIIIIIIIKQKLS